MNDELEQDVSAVSEHEDVEATTDTPEQEPKMVPLAALQAERRKRQELEVKANLYQEFLMREQSQSQEEPAIPEDPNGLVEKHVLKETTQQTKREILETLYQDMNPEAVQKINKYLKPILEKKPWLAASVDSAQNRWSRANEIVNDYLHLVEDKPSTKVADNRVADAKRMVQNAQKPGSTADVGRTAQPGGMEFLKSIQGKKEFREYRQKMLKG